MSLVKGLKSQAKKTSSEQQPDIQPELTNQPETPLEVTPTDNNKVDDPIVNLVAKVPRSHRNHWLGEARKEGRTLSAVVSELLAQRYSTPGS